MQHSQNLLYKAFVTIHSRCWRNRECRAYYIPQKVTIFSSCLSHLLQSLACVHPLLEVRTEASRLCKVWRYCLTRCRDCVADNFAKEHKIQVRNLLYWSAKISCFVNLWFLLSVVGAQITNFVPRCVAGSLDPNPLPSTPSPPPSSPGEQATQATFLFACRMFILNNLFSTK